MIVSKVVEAIGNSSIDIDGATLLTIEDADRLTKKDRIYDSWWWLKSTGSEFNRASLVLSPGTIYHDGLHIRNSKVYVRPALKLLNKYDFKIGDIFIIKDYRFKVISNSLAWMYEQDIGYCNFNYGAIDSDSNNYDKSDVKKYIDEWYKKLMEDK